MQIDKLLNLYEQHTGSKFGGSDAEYSILSKLVSTALFKQTSLLLRVC